MEELGPYLESFIQFLINKHIVDNGQDTETLSKFLDMTDAFDD